MANFPLKFYFFIEGHTILLDSNLNEGHEIRLKMKCCLPLFQYKLKLLTKWANMLKETINLFGEMSKKQSRDKMKLKVAAPNTSFLSV